MFDRITIAGRMGVDPEMKYTPEGKAITTFSVAGNRQNNKTIWYRVSTWEKLAEIVNEYGKKGRAVLIEGQLQFDEKTGGPRIWTDKDGLARCSFEVTARNVVFLDSPGEASGGGGQARQAAPKAGARNDF